MGRTPCCDKTGLKKGPWTAEEDDVLINFINQNGHDNWRALPKRAGLLRCGKSCRLRWMNYLRPDIKRGNFTPAEEEMIIKLHQELGNRWAVMAARLPGRTDNEIKNVWHANLKKRVNNQTRPEPKTRVCAIESSDEDKNSEANSPVMYSSSSEISSLTYAASGADGVDSSENLPEMDEGFWSDFLTGDDGGASSDISGGSSDDWFDSFGSDELDMDGSMEFWEKLFSRADDHIELPEF